MSPLPVLKVTDREQKNLKSQEKSEADLIPATPESLLGQILAISETRKGEKIVGGKILAKGRNSFHASFLPDSKGKRRNTLDGAIPARGCHM